MNKKCIIYKTLSVMGIAMLLSCSTPQNVEYFQNSAQLNGMLMQQEQQFKLRPEDKVNIVVNSADPALEQQFTDRKSVV